MYNIYYDNINTLGYKRKQNAYIILLLTVFNIPFSISIYPHGKYPLRKHDNTFKITKRPSKSV